MAVLLLSSVFVVATCGLIYELIAGALASYLLGDSVTQFSTIIGVYLFSMGIGSYLSKFIDQKLISTFIKIELLIGVVGGCSAAILFLGFGFIDHFRVLLYLMVSITGILVGLEIPLLMRILQNQYEFKDLVSKVFTFDYIGALIASVLFPLVLMPYLGLTRSAFLFGAINVSVGIFAIYFFRYELDDKRPLAFFAVLSMLTLSIGFIFGDKITDFAEQSNYEHNIIYAHSTPYQRIVLTKSRKDLRLYLNGHLQFSSRDEYRYHEALVHVGLSRLHAPKRVLVLGGGDGLATREILKYKTIEKITLIDLDPSITSLFRNNEFLSSINENSLRSDKIMVINADAFLWLKDNKERFDFIVIDFPDPSNYSVGKLYSVTFYNYLKSCLTEDGVLVVQATSPFVARQSFWCIAHTLKSVGFKISPYHVHLPSFGSWGFILAGKKDIPSDWDLPKGLKFLTNEFIPGLFIFPKDIGEIETDINHLYNQMLVRYFENEWSSYVL